MRFSPTAVDGAYVVDPEPIVDDRGSFARIFAVDEFVERGLDPTIVQANLSRNRLAGTLRGLHFQRSPHQEDKLVRCIRGRLFDVVVDLRPASPTYRAWAGIELTAENGRALYVPKGCAHGFLTLEDDTEATYHVSAAYAPDHEGGARYDDPAFAIEWPRPVAVLSDKDASWPPFTSEAGA